MRISPLIVMALVPCLHAATPLITQYIAPVGNPTWEAAVEKSEYGKNKGFTFRCALNKNNVNYANYIIKVDGQYLTAWNKWVQFVVENRSYKGSFERSVTSSVPTRYLYPIVTNVSEGNVSVSGEAVSGSKSVQIASPNAWLVPTEELIVSNNLDNTPDCTPSNATYVQCVHTDWVYQVTFNANGGSGSMSSNPFVYTNSASLPPNRFVKAGFKFSGWNTASDGTGVPYDDAQRIESTDIPNLYAQWVDNTYTVLFSKSDEVGVTGEMDPQVFSYGEPEALTSNKFVRTGYSFLGWSTAPGASVQYLDGQIVSNLGQVGSTITLYARWGQNGYKVTLDPQGGSGGTANVTANYGVVVPNVVPPVNDGYSFGGYWSEPYGGGEQYIDKNGNGIKDWRIDSAGTLYAKWSEVFYPVSFHANGGVFDNDEPDITIDDKYHIGLEYGELPTPEPLSGALFFAGWWTSTDSTNRTQVIASDIVADSVTNLYARWKTVAEDSLCTLTFKWGSKPDESISTNALIGTEFGKYFPSPSPTDAAGRVIFGWYDGARHVLNTDIVQGDVTLKGEWTFGEFNQAFGCYDIVFDTTGDGAAKWSINDDGFAQSGAIESPANDSTSTLLMAPERSGSLSIELKVSCYANIEWNTLDLYTGDNPQDPETGAITNLCGIMEDFVRSPARHVAAGEEVKLEYYRFSDNYLVGQDCGWARNLMWIPDPEPTAIDDWESFIAVTSSVHGAYWTTGGAETWATVETNKSFAAAATIDNGCSSWIRLDVPATAGVLEFEWRVSGETGYIDTNGVYQLCDYLEFADESQSSLSSASPCRLVLEGLTNGFVKIVVTNDIEEAHTFRWRYVKDGSDVDGDDGAWLRNVVWTPKREEAAETVVEYEYEEGGVKKQGAVAVPNSWIDEFDLIGVTGVQEGDYYAALTKYSGKTGPGGAPLSYWADYIAGTVPTNSASVFKLTGISIENGAVYLKWDPDWSDPDGEIYRQYTVWGKTNLTDAAWHTPTNSASRFFSVEVSLPKIDQ